MTQRGEEGVLRMRAPENCRERAALFTTTVLSIFFARIIVCLTLIHQGSHRKIFNPDYTDWLTRPH